MIKRYLSLCLLGIIVFPLYAELSNDNHFSMELLFKKSKFYGYYLPLDFVESFENTKNWFFSRKYINDGHFIEFDECVEDYIYIRIDKYGIWVQKPIRGDGCSEELIDNRNGIENYRYEKGINNEIVMFKDNGKKFKKISNTFEYDFTTLDNYIGRIVLKDFILSGELTLDNNIITIPALDYGKFRIETWDNFSDYNAKLYIYGFDRGWWLDMDVEGDLITIYAYETWIFDRRTGKKVYWRNKI